MTETNPFSFPVPERRSNKPSDPENLFRSLSRRASSVQHLWAHQADVLRNWHTNYVSTTDLALELPTGTGKTLIGLLIGEFVRQTKGYRVAYLCPNRQLAYQVGTLAADYSIDVRVLVGPQVSYPPDDFNAFVSSSALAVTTYSSVFNTNPKINSANLLILDDAHASEDFIASLWNVEIERGEQGDIYFGLLDLFRDVIQGSQFWNLTSEMAPQEALLECTKIPTPIVQNRWESVREFLDSALAKSNLLHPWGMVRDHLDACHLYITWSSISIRPITPPTYSHSPFASSNQRIYMSATLGEGGELERITGVRKIERLPAPEGWDREGTGRRFILFPDQAMPSATATNAALTLAGESTRSLILTPNRWTTDQIKDKLKNFSPRPDVVLAQDIENSLDPFLTKSHAALVLHNRYDGLDLPGDACHLEWICGLPRATNAQESFLLNRVNIEALLEDRIRTRLTQALGRCTRNATDHALVVISGSEALDFCNKFESRSGFHPELQAEIEYGLSASKAQWPSDFLGLARAFLRQTAGWEAPDQWIREQRDSYSKHKNVVAQTLMENVPDEIDYANFLWTGNYQGALDKARACADRLSGQNLAAYRAWWHYLAGSAAPLSVKNDNASHLGETARDQFTRACSASPMITWFREVVRHNEFGVHIQTEIDTTLLVAVEAIERQLLQVGISGPRFENEAQSLIDLLAKSESTPFEQGLELLGTWLGVDAKRPKGQGVPDGIWVFGEMAIVALEAKSDENPAGKISISTAREAQGHIKWVKSELNVPDCTPISSVVISDRSIMAPEAKPHIEALYVVSLDFIRQLASKVISTIRGLRAQASEVGSEEFRQVIAERLSQEKLDPDSLLSDLLRCRISDLPS